MKDSGNMQDQDVDTDLEFEDWELDYTSDMVEEFLEEQILPSLEEFDFNNEDENYIPGVACFTLYTKLVSVLTENGWSTNDLKNAIDEFQAACSESDNLH